MSSRGVSRSTRRFVAERARYLCEYCLSREDHSPVGHSVEHILPKSRGGTNDLANLALACQECNNHKFDRTESIDPQTGDMVPLYHPRQDTWREHFRWSEDYTLLIGLTSTGRATVEALQLNRTRVVNFRRVLHEFGKHPLPEPDASDDLQ